MPPVSTTIDKKFKNDLEKETGVILPPDTVVIRLEGTFISSYEVDMFEEAINKCIGNNVILDFSKLRTLNSAAISILLYLYQENLNKGKKTIIAHIPEYISELFFYTGHSQLFPTFKTLKEAVDELKK